MFIHAVAYLKPSVTPTYLKPWHIWNPRYVQNSAKAYAGIFRTLCHAHILRPLPYSELSHKRKFGIFRTGGIFKILHTSAYSYIFNNDSYN